MASTTPNIGLTLPTGAEKVSRQIINENNTKIDTAFGGTAGRELLGFKENGDTASQAIADGSFVVWKGNLYKANGAIPQGTAFSGSNLTAVTDGGFNDLQSSVDSLSDSIASQNITQLTSESAKYTFPQGQFSKSHYVVRGNVCYISAVFNCVTASATAERICGSLPNPALDDHTCCPGCAISWTVTTDVGVQVLVQNGVMYFCGGTAGRMYSLAFSYPVDISV